MGPGATGSTASAAVEAVLTSIQKAANTNPKLHIAGFGTFRISPKGKLTFSPARGFLSSSIRITHIFFIYSPPVD